MLKHLLRLTGAVLAFFLLALSWTVTTSVERDFPLGAAASAVIGTRGGQATKAETVEALTRIATDSGAVFYKPVADPEDPAHGRDVIVFGTQATGAVPWFADAFRGVFIPSQDVSTEPLDGSYYLLGCSSACQQALSSWAQGAGAQLIWSSRSSVLVAVVGALGHTGAGLAVVSAVVLMLSVLLTWLAARDHSRAVRLMGGVARWWIRLQDLGALSGLVLPPLLATLVVGLLALLVRFGWDTVRLVGPSLVTVCGLLVALLAACAGLLTALVAPTTRSLARRETSWRQVRWVGLALRATTVLLAAVSLPLTVTSTASAVDSARAQGQWAALPDAYSLILTQDVFAADQEAEVTSRAQAMVEAMDPDRVLLSASIDSLVEVPASAMGGYDHLVMTDQQMLDALGAGSLTEVSEQDLPAATLAAITDNLRFWSADGTSVPRFRLMRASGPGKPVPFMTSGLRSGTVSVSGSPLLIVLDDPVRELDPTGLLMPVIANGGLLYRGYQELEGVVEASGMGRYVAGTDNAAVAVLQQGQDLMQEAWLGGLGGVLIVGALCASLIHAAMTWASRRRQELFLARASGVGSGRLMVAPTLAETACAVLVAVVSWLLFVHGVQGGTSPVLAVVVLVSFVLLYGLGCAAAYAWQARAAFRATVTRVL